MSRTTFDKADFLKHLFDTIPSFIFVVDEDVRIYHLNAASVGLLGVKPAQVFLKRGGEALSCIHSTETPQGCGHASACRDCVIRNSVNRVFHGQKSCRETAKLEQLCDGRRSDIHVMVTASPFRYEEKDFALVVIEDITNLKNIEEELHRHAAQLEAANKELEAFSYSVSHDLKSPLRSICGFTDALLEEYASLLDAEALDYLTRIRSSGIRMTQLVDDMLNLFRTTTAGLQLEDVDLSDLMRSIADDSLKAFPRRSIDVVIGPGIRAICDRRLIRIVLENLFGNAVKFTSAHQAACIEFGTQRKDGLTVFFVKDDGAGFDMAEAAGLFQPFKRLHEPARFPGTGIGLATVRRIIHRHQGRIWAESSVEKGAAFFFTLGRENRTPMKP